MGVPDPPDLSEAQSPFVSSAGEKSVAKPRKPSVSLAWLIDQLEQLAVAHGPGTPVYLYEFASGALLRFHPRHPPHWSLADGRGVGSCANLVVGLIDDPAVTPEC